MTNTTLMEILDVHDELEEIRKDDNNVSIETMLKVFHAVGSNTSRATQDPRLSNVSAITREVLDIADLICRIGMRAAYKARELEADNKRLRETMEMISNESV